jgi:hypothetical protein
MDAFKQLRIIYWAMVSGQVVYFIVSLLLIQDEAIELDRDYNDIWGLVIPIIVVIMVVSSKLFYNYMVNSGLEKSLEAQKIKTYKTSNVIKFALLEGANLLSVTFYLLTGDFLYAGMFIIVLGIFLLNIPGKEKFMIEFELSSVEK